MYLLQNTNGNIKIKTLYLFINSEKRNVETNIKRYWKTWCIVNLL